VSQLVTCHSSELKIKSYSSVTNNKIIKKNNKKILVKVKKLKFRATGIKIKNSPS